MYSFSDESNRACVILFVFTFVVIASIIIGSYYHRKNNNIIETGVELQKQNDSIKLEVKQLDSIKNAKVIEVKTLDNDSTIKLFYKLIK